MGMQSEIEAQAERMLGEYPTVQLAGSVVDEREAFSIAMRLECGMLMEPRNVRDQTDIVAVLFKKSATQVVIAQMKEIARLKTQIAATNGLVETRKSVAQHVQEKKSRLTDVPC